MRIPSFSIAGMMVVVAIGALDCLAIRLGAHAGVLVGGLPMQTVLVIGLSLVFRWRRIGDKRLSFLMGFEVGGWISSVILLSVSVFALQSFDQHLGHILDPAFKATGFKPFSPQDIICRVALGMAYLTALQLAAAVIGGWISQTWWKLTHPERVPTHE
jgi:hypothetical protein